MNRICIRWLSGAAPDVDGDRNLTAAALVHARQHDAQLARASVAWARPASKATSQPHGAGEAAEAALREVEGGLAMRAVRGALVTGHDDACRR